MSPAGSMKDLILLIFLHSTLPVKTYIINSPLAGYLLYRSLSVSLDQI